MLLNSNVTGYTKKNTTNPIVFSFLRVVYLVGSQTFRDGPSYRHAKISLICLWGLSVVLLSGLYTTNKSDNKKREDTVIEDREAAAAAGGIHGNAFLDLTDKENKQIRYVI